MKKNIVGMSAIVLAGVFLLTGCDQLDDLLKQNIAGTFEYDKESMSIEMGEEGSAEFRNVEGKTLTFSIDPDDAPGISIDSTTGKISVGTDAEPINKEFTITATGIGNYKGVMTATININVYKGIKGSLLYDAISILPGASGSQDAQWANGDANQEVSYSIDPEVTGVSVDSKTGQVRIDSSADLMDQIFTVTASGTGDYGGQIEGTIHVNVQKEAIVGSFQYDAISLLLGNSGSEEPTWTGAKPEQTVSYSISPSVSGVSIDATTGEVRVSTNTSEISQEFTVSAKGTGVYGGEITAPIQIDIQLETIEGTLQYSDISILLGNSDTQSPQWSDAKAGQTVSYSISPSVSGVSIDSSSGRVSVSADASVMSQEFTVSATGSGSYGGKITATIRVDVQRELITGSFQYNAISMQYGDSGSQFPNWTGARPGQVVRYSIAPSVSGVTVDAVTGEMKASSSAGIMSETFTVTASGTDSYGGKIAGTISVEVQQASIAGTLRYSNISVESGSSGSKNPQWSGAKSGQTVSYSILPSVSGVSVDRSTGVVSTSSNLGLMSQSFTITATGTGNYTGTAVGTIQVEVRKQGIAGTLRYNSITVEHGVSGNQNPQWSGAKSGQTVSYSISPSVSGVSVNSSSGRVTVSSGTGIISRDFTITATATGSYTGTIKGYIRVDVGKLGISGTLRYSSISVEYGDGGSQNPQWSGAKSGQTVSYRISPSVSGVSVDSSGRVSVSSSAGIMSRDFTVTATGTNVYSGTVIGTARVEIREANISGTLSYRALSVEYGESGSQSPQWSGAKSGQAVRYSISPSASGVSIDSSSGRVSVGSNVDIMSREFTVTATGTGSFTGSATGRIQVGVREANISGGRLSYSGITVDLGNSGSQNPQWSGAKSGQTVRYSISPSVSGVSIDSSTGRVSVSSSTAVMSRDFSVTATGTGAYTGSATGSIRIEVQRARITGSLRYNAISMEYLQSRSQSPVEKPAQTVSYSISPSVSGVSLDSSTGRVSVSSGTAVMARSFTVTATGTGSYTGTINGSIWIEINRAQLSGSFSYDSISIEDDEWEDEYPQWTVSGQTMVYSISPNYISGIRFDSDDGEITVERDADPMDRRFTITATGTGNYTGTKTATINVEVRPEPADLHVTNLSASPNRVEIGNTFDLTVEITNNGGSTSSSSGTTFYVYESTNTTIDGDDDRYVGYVEIVSLAPGRTYTHTISISPSRTEGTYYYGAVKTGWWSWEYEQVTVVPSDIGDTYRTAKSVNLNDQHYHPNYYEIEEYTEDGDEDWYKVVLPTWGRTSVELIVWSVSSIDVDGYLYDERHTSVGDFPVKDTDSDDFAVSYIDSSALLANTYYIKVKGWDSGKYSIRFRLAHR